MARKTLSNIAKIKKIKLICFIFAVRASSNKITKKTINLIYLQNQTSFSFIRFFFLVANTMSKFMRITKFTNIIITSYFILCLFICFHFINKQKFSNRNFLILNKKKKTINKKHIKNFQTICNVSWCWTWNSSGTALPVHSVQCCIFA